MNTDDHKPATVPQDEQPQPPKRRMRRHLVALLLALAILLTLPLWLYLPPVQRAAVSLACHYVEQTTGLHTEIGSIYIAFPLDLKASDVLCTGGRDTIARIATARATVALTPLFEGRVAIKHLDLRRADINTATLIPDLCLAGHVGRLAVLMPPPPAADINLDRRTARIATAALHDATLHVTLADTAKPDTTTSRPWRIAIRRLDIKRTTLALTTHYAATGRQELGSAYFGSLRADRTGIDLVAKRYTLPAIAARDIKADISNTCYELRTLHAAAVVDSLHITTRLAATTPAGSRLAAHATIPFAAFDTVPDRPLITPHSSLLTQLSATISHADLARYAFPYLPREATRIMPLQPVNVKADISGNLQQLHLTHLQADIPTVASLQGTCHYRAQPQAANADITISTYNLTCLRPLLPAALRLPPTTARIKAQMNGNQLQAQLTTPGLRANGTYNTRTTATTASVQTQGFNVARYMPTLGIGNITANASVQTRGTSLSSANINIKSCSTAFCNRHTFRNITLDAQAANLPQHRPPTQAANLNSYFLILNSHDPLAAGNITLALKQPNNQTTLTGELTADLHRLGLVPKPLVVALTPDVALTYRLPHQADARATLRNIVITDSAGEHRPDDITLRLLTRRDTTALHLTCGDFLARLNAQGGYQWLLGCADRITNIARRQLAAATIDQQALRQALPHADITLHTGQSNPLARIAAYYGLTLQSADIDLHTSRENGANGNIDITGLDYGEHHFDTLALALTSKNEPPRTLYHARITTVPCDTIKRRAFTALLDGELLEHGLSAQAELYNDTGQLALRLGAAATVDQQGITLRLTPDKPVIGYETFTLQPGSYLRLAPTGRLHADINATASDGTGIKLYSTEEEQNETHENLNSKFLILNSPQDLTLSLHRLNLGRLAAIPLMPDIAGYLDGDFHFLQTAEHNFSIAADADIAGLQYEGADIGDIGTTLTYIPRPDGSHYIDGNITKDGAEVGTINGTYNFDTQQVQAAATLHTFPLALADIFMPDGLIAFEGTASGDIDVAGTSAKPAANGAITLHNAALVSLPYSIRLQADDVPLTLSDSRLLLEDFKLYDATRTPVTLNGNVDFHDASHTRVDLNVKTHNFLLVNAKENTRADAYGRLYIDLAAAVRGTASRLNMLGKIDVLPATNLYYVLRDSPLTADNSLAELVTFVDFAGQNNKTTKQQNDQSTFSATLALTAHEGARIKCWLGAIGSNYIDFTGEGDLRLTYRTGTLGLSGRYTIGSGGEMRYQLPIIPLKTFAIASGSNITWRGDMFNPALDITATETRNANATVAGVEQPVKFQSGVRLSKTLSDMGIEFLIDAPENQTVSDELAMLSAEERGRLAVTMLTTGLYLADGNTAKFTMNSALNAFLQSEINAIAAGALRSVDLSFGMDNSTNSRGEAHTDYNFRFARRFWNNRLQIAVGGKLSSGTEMEGENRSFFDNVDMQYRLSDTSNQYLQLFYRRAVYDFLEGHTDHFGAGYMWKKKLQHLFRK